MEPAFGGVKSRQMLLILSFALRRGALGLRLRRLSVSVYIRYMTNHVSRKAIDRFLRQLRASGRSNMYGAIPYLMKTFSLDRNTAFTMVCEWLDRQLDVEVERSRATTRSR